MESALIEMVLYVPNLGVNLFSIAAITKLGVTVHFIEARVSFNKNESVVMVGERIGKTLSFSSSPYSVACFTISPTPSIDTCHQRLAHTRVKKIRKMASQELVNGLILITNDTSTINPCPGCMYGKMKRSEFKIDRTRATQIGQLIHSDLCGPMPVTTPRGSKYLVFFTDDFSSYRAFSLNRNQR